MNIRIWLTSGADRAIETKQEVAKYRDNKMEDISRLNGLEVKSDPSGEKYIELYADPLDPATSVPTIKRTYIKRVSFVDKYSAGFRTDGIYRLKGATARVETNRSFHGGFDKGQLEETYQYISISAGSIRTLREIYTQVRQGKLKPAEDWGTGLPMLELRQQQAAKKTATNEDEDGAVREQ